MQTHQNASLRFKIGILPQEDPLEKKGNFEKKGKSCQRRTRYTASRPVSLIVRRTTMPYDDTSIDSVQRLTTNIKLLTI